MSGHILIVDDVPTNRIILKAKLSSEYYEVSDAESGEEALSMARAQPPDIILLDVMLPGIDGFEVCHQLKADRRTAHIPIVMITALNSAEEKIRGLEAGADDFLEKPINGVALSARVKSLMRTKMMIDELHLRSETTRDLGLCDAATEFDPDAQSSGQVLLAAPDAETAADWCAVIETRLGLEVTIATNEAEALTLAGTQCPDMFVIHQHFGKEQAGLHLVSAIRARMALRMASIVFVTAAPEDVATAAVALDLGATDYITTPFDPAELAARLRAQMRRKRYSDHLRSNVMDGLKLAAIDPLTGLYNRRYAQQHLERLMRRPGSGGRLTLLMIDLDQFKRVNDLFGHTTGDQVLREFALRLQENVRGVDLVARLGGEEFCVGMPETTLKDAVAIAERLRAVMEKEPFRINRGQDDLFVTVSIGAASCEGTDMGLDSLIRQADTALYEAKNTRNAVKTFPEAA